MDCKVDKHEFGVVQCFWTRSNHSMTQVTRCVEKCNWWFNPTEPFPITVLHGGSKDYIAISHELGVGGWGGSTLLNLFDQIWSLGQNLDGTIFAMTGSPNNKRVSVERSARMMPIIFQLFLVNLALFMAWVWGYSYFLVEDELTNFHPDVPSHSHFHTLTSLQLGSGRRMLQSSSSLPW